MLQELSDPLSGTKLLGPPIDLAQGNAKEFGSTQLCKTPLFATTDSPVQDKSGDQDQTYDFPLLARKISKPID